MKKSLFVLLLAAIAYLLLWPTRVEPIAWQPQPMPSLETGTFATNNKLADIQSIAKAGLSGPEYVQIADGHLYAGYVSGEIMRFDLGGQNGQLVAHTEGRPLGIHVLKNGTLLVADAVKGLLQITAEGTITVLADQYKNQRLLFVDELTVTADEQWVFFSDASTKFGVHDYKLDFMEHGPNGRIFRYHLPSKKLDVVMDLLQFANGVAAGPNDDYILVNETGEHRVWRYWLQGPQAGKAEIFVDNLPGYPDNITFNGTDRFWIALASARNPMLTFLANKPWLAKIASRLPRWIQPGPIPHAFAVGIDLRGNVVANLQYKASDAYSPITTVKQYGEALFFGSLTADSIGYLPQIPK